MCAASASCLCAAASARWAAAALTCAAAVAECACASCESAACEPAACIGRCKVRRPVMAVFAARAGRVARVACGRTVLGCRFPAFLCPPSCVGFASVPAAVPEEASAGSRETITELAQHAYHVAMRGPPSACVGAASFPQPLRPPQRSSPPPALTPSGVLRDAYAPALQHACDRSRQRLSLIHI